jgi:hypothetical protein
MPLSPFAFLFFPTPLPSLLMPLTFTFAFPRLFGIIISANIGSSFF